MRDKIKLLSTGKTIKGKPTGTFDTTTKNKKNSTEKIQKKRYDRLAINPKTGKPGCHVLFVETKL